MENQSQARLPFRILPQPDEETCGPTCLESLYHFYGDEVPLEQLIREVPMLESGGTLAVWLGCHALRRGYRATLYTYKLQLFDPSWLTGQTVDVQAKLRAQMAHKSDAKLHVASRGFIEFLDLGGEVRCEDLTGALIRRFLNRGTPILTGLSATWLYRSPREYGPNCDYDDVRGEPSGHFVVLRGYDRLSRTVAVADPLQTNPLTGTQKYEASMERVINAILLGVLTYDANLLIVQPKTEKGHHGPSSSDRRG